MSSVQLLLGQTLREYIWFSSSRDGSQVQRLFLADELLARDMREKQ
jgi:hypothetical protein